LVLLQAKTIEMPRVWVLELCDTIKALQQEIDGWQKRYEELDAGNSKLFKDFCGLQQEMTELRAELETTKHIANTQTEAAIDYQQEIERLRLEAYNDGLHNDRLDRLVKANGEFQRQIEQLQERNGAYREALESLFEIGCLDYGYCELCAKEHNCSAFGAKTQALASIKRVLSTSPTTCHNPADVEALAKARDALKIAYKEMFDGGIWKGRDKVHKALAEIKKAVGE
jgi:FtsZ-binding cell division protein ZapB